MVSILLISFGILAFIHWLYEDVIAPSLRDWLRYQLFELRDQVRMLKIVHGNELSDELYSYLQRSLNNALKYMPLLNVSFILRASDAVKEMSTNPILVRNEALLEECNIEEIHKIRKRQRDLIGYALLINMGGWLIYLIPVLILMRFFGDIKDLTKQTLYMPERDIVKLITDSPVPETRIMHA